MSFVIKICGLRTPEALDAALDAGADMVGFVFFPPSPRNLGMEAARTLGRYVKGRALLIYWSLNVRPAPRHGLSMRQRARRLFGILQHLVQNTRWERTFRLVR